MVDFRSAQRDVRHDPRGRARRDPRLCPRAHSIRALQKSPSLNKLSADVCVLQLFWSILLLCLGRHPSQNPHHFTPDIGQVPRSVVDKLPLVYYIPPPPDQPSKPVTLPSDLHSYPPKPPPDSRRRFRLFTRRNGGGGGKSSSSSSRGGGGTTKSGAGKGKGKGKGSNKRPLTWEDNWERGAYPFVQLDGHRASCAICLLDFQEPKRVSEGALKTAEADRPDSSDAQTQGGPNDAAAAAAEEEEEAEADTEADNEAGGRGEEVEEVGEVTELTTTTATPPLSPSGDNSHNLRLQDAGQGAQPLRLLKCGHVFHVSLSRLTWERVLHVLTPEQKTCVDPWLLDVSGRCPVCQRPVRGTEPEETTAGTGQDTRPARRQWFRRNRRRGPA